MKSSIQYSACQRRLAVHAGVKSWRLSQSWENSSRVLSISEDQLSQYLAQGFCAHHRRLQGALEQMRRRILELAWCTQMRVQVRGRMVSKQCRKPNGGKERRAGGVPCCRINERIRSMCMCEICVRW